MKNHKGTDNAGGVSITLTHSNNKKKKLLTLQSTEAERNALSKCSGGFEGNRTNVEYCPHLSLCAKIKLPF